MLAAAPVLTESQVLKWTICRLLTSHCWTYATRRVTRVYPNNHSVGSSSCAGWDAVAPIKVFCRLALLSAILGQTDHRLSVGQAQSEHTASPGDTQTALVSGTVVTELSPLPIDGRPDRQRSQWVNPVSTVNAAQNVIFLPKIEHDSGVNPEKKHGRLSIH